MAFTKDQIKAIETEGSNIIVSAGAGSGKTAVLTERVIRKLLNGVDVDHLLVLTFTNEAANEMKSRIREAIIKNKLDNQLGLLDSSYITTFDSYAFSLVKKYHYLLGISDKLKIIDSNIITIYKNNLLDKIFNDMYDNINFQNLISDYTTKDDTSIKEFILEINNQLDLLINKEEYLDNYLDKYFSSQYLNNLVNKYEELIKKKIKELQEVYESFLDYIDNDLINKLDTWFNPLFNGQSYADYVLFTTIPTVKFTKIPEEGDSTKKELLKVKDEILNLLRFKDIDEIKDTLLLNKEHIKVIIEIIRKLDKEVSIYKDKYEIYEFNDISHMAIKIVKDNLEVRNEIKTYFNEIMVDEYQDTSSIQEAFINYISNNNVYMVGDIKQSIYRFRNANPYIFQNKYDNYSKDNGGIKIDLLKNFRSRRETLYNINEIFNLIMDNDIGDANYIESHNMVYGLEDYDLEDTKHNNYLDIYNYQIKDDEECTKEEKELFIISKDIIDKINNHYQVFDKHTKKLRDITYSDICIITDKNKYLSDYKKILMYHGIPSVLYMDEKLTSNNLSLVIKNLLDLVDHVKNKIYDDKFRYVFASIARSFIFCYNDNLIYEINMNKSFKDTDIVKLCYDIDINKPLLDIIYDTIKIFNIYDRLTILPDIEENIVNLDNLINIASSLNTLGYSLTEFINYLNDTDKYNLEIKYNINTKGGNAVKIMNIHKSKGLEFSLCYFTGMHNKFNVSDLKTKYIFHEKYGIILPYLKDNELLETINKDLYKEMYYREEVSEKIRLFYVALTRCREKMIIVTSLKEDRDGYQNLVPYNKRIKYMSFLDILNSVKVIDKYIIDKDVIVNKDYDKVILKDITPEDSNIILNKKQLDIKYEVKENSHFSKEHTGLFKKEDLKKMEYGTKIHESLEYADFKNSHNKYLNNLLKKIDHNFINTYHEYEFIYEEDNHEYHGIIDLMIEYENVLYIIDYKLKNISDDAYLKQLAGYKNYIKGITHKEVKTYLYSIMDDSLMEVECEK